MNSKTRLGCVVAVVFSAVLTVLAQNRPADIPKLDFEKYSLPNGLEVILSQDHRLPLVGVDLWYHVGPAYEAPGRTGFAHLFEHMMFQGSKHVRRLALPIARRRRRNRAERNDGLRSHQLF